MMTRQGAAALVLLPGATSAAGLLALLLAGCASLGAGRSKAPDAPASAQFQNVIGGDDEKCHGAANCVTYNLSLRPATPRVHIALDAPAGVRLHVRAARPGAPAQEADGTTIDLDLNPGSSESSTLLDVHVLSDTDPAVPFTVTVAPGDVATLSGPPDKETRAARFARIEKEHEENVRKRAASDAVAARMSEIKAAQDAAREKSCTATGPWTRVYFHTSHTGSQGTEHSYFFCGESRLSRSESDSWSSSMSIGPDIESYVATQAQALNVAQKRYNETRSPAASAELERARAAHKAKLSEAFIKLRPSHNALVAEAKKSTMPAVETP